MEDTLVEHFYGVYLLYCVNPAYKGRCYIGYTVDPNRRLKQHNKGAKFGGARRTSQRGPWVMALIVHGFPNDISALRFEWTWQHPHRSRRLNVTRKKTKESSYEYMLRVMSEMLTVAPWKRLPLTVRWLQDQLRRDLPKPPPIHMPITRGPVICKKLPKDPDNSSASPSNGDNNCSLCHLHVETDRRMTCLNGDCQLSCHVTCLAPHFLTNRGQYVPVEGKCPECGLECLWGDLVRKLRGCYRNQNIVVLETDDIYCQDDCDS